MLRPTASNSSGSAFIGLLETKTSSNGVLELLLRMAEALSFHVIELFYYFFYEIFMITREIVTMFMEW